MAPPTFAHDANRIKGKKERARKIHTGAGADRGVLDLEESLGGHDCGSREGSGRVKSGK